MRMKECERFKDSKIQRYSWLSLASAALCEKPQRSLRFFFTAKVAEKTQRTRSGQAGNRSPGKSEWKQATRNGIQIHFFFVIPVKSGRVKIFQLSQKRPSKVDLPRHVFKEMNNHIAN